MLMVFRVIWVYGVVGDTAASGCHRGRRVKSEVRVIGEEGEGVRGRRGGGGGGNWRGGSVVWIFELGAVSVRKRTAPGD